jgi:hypothetical protein
MRTITILSDTVLAVNRTVTNASAQPAAWINKLFRENSFSLEAMTTLLMPPDSRAYPALRNDDCKR